MTGGRYERQILLPEIGVGGQARLSAASALVVGCGGLGCTLLLCLCSIGVGRIGFCDGDVVAEHNLNRQFLHTPADIGRKKVQSAFEKLSAYAPELALEPYDLFISQGNAAALVSGYDIVLLAVDSVGARLTVNRACVPAGIPLVDAGVNGFRGSLFSVRPGKTACLDCLYGDVSQETEVIPSFAPIVSVVASLEAQCAANILLDLPNPSDGRLLLFDGSAMTLDSVSIGRNPNCPACRT
jgi:molybdopterin/thiamine biosynthesis adenylyltransferase